MAFIHTAKGLQGDDKSHTRKSEGHVYEACLVMTYTERSAEGRVEARIAGERELEEAIEERAKVRAETGMTDAEARAKYEEQKEAWYSKAIPRDIRYEDEAKVKLGYVNPYKTAYSKQCDIVSRIDRLERYLREWQPVKVGDQFVISWHHTVGNAHKASNGQTAQYERKRGHSVNIHTDIEVRETKKRQKKTG